MKYIITGILDIPDEDSPVEIVLDRVMIDPYVLMDLKVTQVSKMLTVVEPQGASMKTKYSKNIDDVFGLVITETNVATVTGDTDQPEVTVQLANDEEASKMIAEFEDPDGELMQAEDSVFKKYPQLAPFIP